MSACCGLAAVADGAAARLAPFDCFQRGLATRRLPALALAGPRMRAPDGAWAAFSLTVDSCGCVAGLRFACTTCTTLIACCQALVELNCGCAPAPAPLCVGSASDLWTHLPGMPRAKWDRAVLAVAALRAAVAQQTGDALATTAGTVRPRTCTSSPIVGGTWSSWWS